MRRDSLSVISVAHPYKNVPPRAVHIRFSCAEGTLYLRLCEPHFPRKSKEVIFLAKENDMLLGMEMPYSLEAEQSVLGAVLVEPGCLAELVEHLRPESFYRPQHRAIFTEMVRIFTAGEPVDFITVLEAAKEAEIFPSEQEAKVYLSHLMEIVPSVRNLDAYVGIIQDKQVLRSLLEISGEIMTEARESGADGKVLLDSAEQRIYDLRQGRSVAGLVPISSTILDAYDQINKLAGPDREKYLGIKTGYSAVDRKIGGLNKSDLILIAARPGMGKTSFALNIAVNVALKKRKVAVFSLEMSSEQITSRILSCEALVESNRLRSGNLESEDWVKLAQTAQILSGTQIFIDDTAGITISEMKAKLRRLRDVDLVIVDYLQLMSSTGNTDNRVQVVSEMTRNLKLMARELNVPVVVLSQLSRATESRTGHRPMLSDLRESGSIEQDADIVMFLYRESYYQLQEGAPAPEQDTVECIISKNRHGETGSAVMLWDGRHTKFYTIEEDR